MMAEQLLEETERAGIPLTVTFTGRSTETHRPHFEWSGGLSLADLRSANRRSVWRGIVHLRSERMS